MFIPANNIRIGNFGKLMLDQKLAYGAAVMVSLKLLTPDTFVPTKIH
jgi:hypothetical protein